VPFKAPGGPLVPVVTCIAIAWLLWATVTKREFIALVAAVGLAVVMYAVRRVRSSRSGGDRRLG
jgi:hypothetical protein